MTNRDMRQVLTVSAIPLPAAKESGRSSPTRAPTLPATGERWAHGIKTRATHDLDRAAQRSRTFPSTRPGDAHRLRLAMKHYGVQSPQPQQLRRA
jgi:hypothetical protein